MKVLKIGKTILFVSLIIALCDAKGGRGSSGRSSSSSKSSSSSSKSYSSSSKSSSSSSGSSYPKQQYRPSAPSYNYGQPSAPPSQPSYNYGRPAAQPSYPSYNYGQPSVPSHNYGQPSAPPLPSRNFGQPSAPPLPSHNFGQPSAPPLPSHNYGQPSYPSYNYGQPPAIPSYPSPNFGRPSVQPSYPIPNSPNFRMPSVQPSHSSHNYGQPPSFGSSHPVVTKPNKGSSKTNAIVGAAVGAYATHKAHKNAKKLKKIIKGPKIKGVHIHGSGRMHHGGHRISGNGGSNIIFLATVSTDEWGSRPIMGVHLRSAVETNKIIVHHTTFEDCYNMSACIDVLKKVEAKNIDVLGYPNIGYNFMIGGDGRIYVGLGWHHYSKLTNTSYDERSLQVAFIGDFSVFRPNDKQLTAFRALIRYADKRDYIKHYRIHAHRDVACTTCPGNALYLKLKEFARYEPLLDQATLCPLNNTLGLTNTTTVSTNTTGTITVSLTSINGTDLVV